MTLLEVCVDNLESVHAAVAGGAARIELCANLNEGGLTPSLDFLRHASKIISDAAPASVVTLFPMIRCRPGNFIYSREEYACMEAQMSEFLNAGGCRIDGFVFGGLVGSGNSSKEGGISGNNKKGLDFEGLRRLLKRAGSLPCTLHRAIDDSGDPLYCSRQAAQLGFARILSSGGAQTAWEGREILRQMRLEQPNLVVMPGSGVTPDNARQIIDFTGCKEIHGSFSTREASRGKVTSVELVRLAAQRLAVP